MTTHTQNPTSTIALSNTFIHVADPEPALAFYRDVLGFTVKLDVSKGGFRWVTLTTPTQPGIELTLNQIGSGVPASDADNEALKDLLAKGLITFLIFDCDDVDALFEHVRASGAEVLQEPADQFYGVRDCAFRDPAGNMVRFKSPLPQQG
ncbi:VOC family protein [Nocardioides sp. GCM10027113]|uniref:VOC family protein n=1 Tax=unclassified Nocardioides TaxID=2615069 RepID=UPI00360EACB0